MLIGILQPENSIPMLTNMFFLTDSLQIIYQTCKYSDIPMYNMHKNEWLMTAVETDE